MTANRKRWLLAGVFGYLGLVALVLLALGSFRAEAGQGVVQPIPFSHPLHAGGLALDCSHCHQWTTQSRHAGLPEVAICMGCHAEVATESPHIMELARLYEQGGEVAWVRVYENAWHVYFSHKRHVLAGVDCAVCHGDVTVQERIRQVTSLKMGWCVNCHNDNQASVDCATCHR